VSSTEAPISITVKSAAGSLITVRAETGNQLDNLVAEALEAIKAAVTELEAASKNQSSPAPMSTAQVAASLGASIVETGSTYPAQEYNFPPTATIGGGKNCPHGKMTAIQGTGKDGKMYRGYFCPAQKGALDKCKNVYARVGTPDWNTFVADQVK
jgi:hypothetical protein